MTARSREYDPVPAVVLTPHKSDNATVWTCRSWSRCPAQALVRDAAVVALIVDAETP